MRTPIQELIEQLYTMYYKALTIETDLSRTGLSNAICLAESMLEKEEQILKDLAEENYRHGYKEGWDEGTNYGYDAACGR